MNLDPTEPPSLSAAPDPPASDAPRAPLEDIDRTAGLVAPPPEEVELWWGSYSGWTMMPSFLACLLLTVLIGWSGWSFVPREWSRAVVLGGTGLLWLVQLARWTTGSLSTNYRLTTQRLWIMRGLRLTDVMAIELTQVVNVKVVRTWLDRRLGIGRVYLILEGGSATVVLKGVWNAREAAEVIRAAARAARHARSEG